MNRVAIIHTINGIENFYECGRHNLPIEIRFLSVFENIQILRVECHDGTIINGWEEYCEDFSVSNEDSNKEVA